MTLRSIDDTKLINGAITKQSEIVVIGTSFIGMEVAMAIQKKEPKSVTLVGVDEVPFEAILGREIGKSIQKVRSLLFLFCDTAMLMLMCRPWRTRVSSSSCRQRFRRSRRQVSCFGYTSDDCGELTTRGQPRTRRNSRN